MKRSKVSTETLEGLRTRHRMNQAEFAIYLGCTQSAVNLWLSGRRSVPQSTARIVEIMRMLETLAPDIHQQFVHQAKLRHEINKRVKPRKPTY